METKKPYKAVEWKPERQTAPYDKRWAIADIETGEILDNAQGYGYKSPRNAYAAYTYKAGSKAKRMQKAKKKAAIKGWLKAYPEIEEYMDGASLVYLKSNEKIDMHIAESALEYANGLGITYDFTAPELLKAWGSE